MPNTEQITIRRASPHDYIHVCRLLDALDELHRQRLPWMFKAPHVQPRSQTFFADLLNRDDSAVFVADAAHLVGVALGLMRTAPAFPVYIQQRWGVVDNLVVDPAWRRHGIGKMLALSVEKWALGLGAPWVELSVYEFNTDARRFYESLGYLPLATRLRKPGPDAA